MQHLKHEQQQPMIDCLLVGFQVKTLMEHQFKSKIASKNEELNGKMDKLVYGYVRILQKHLSS